MDQHSLTSDQKRKFRIISIFKKYEKEYYSMDRSQRCNLPDPSDILNYGKITFNDMDEYNKYYSDNN